MPFKIPTKRIEITYRCTGCNKETVYVTVLAEHMRWCQERLPYNGPGTGHICRAWLIPINQVEIPYKQD